MCSVWSLTPLKVGGGGGPGGGGGGGGIGILSLCWHLSVLGKDRWLHGLSWDNTHTPTPAKQQTLFQLVKLKNDHSNPGTSSKVQPLCGSALEVRCKTPG